MYKGKKRRADRKVTVKSGSSIVVNEDGEILSDSTLTKEITIKGKSKYTTMYLDDENLFEALKGLGNSGAVWGFVLVKYDKENNIFHFSGSVKEQCRKVTGLSDGTVRSSISSFCDSGLLLKIRNAEYMVNPSFFYTGHWDNRQTVIDEYENAKRAKEVLDSSKSMKDKTVDV